MLLTLMNCVCAWLPESGVARTSFQLIIFRFQMLRYKIGKHVINDSVRPFFCCCSVCLFALYCFISLIRFSRALIGKNENDFNYIRKLNVKFRCFAPPSPDFVRCMLVIRLT